MQRQEVILAVDDSKSMLLTLNRLLRDNYIVHTASDGDEGIDLYHERQPDILLLDVNMPRVNGLQVIEHIRRDVGDQDSFILVLTADEDKELKPKALNLGANDFLIKPFDRTELVARMGVAERQTRLTRDLRMYLNRVTMEMQQMANLQHKLLPRAGLEFEGLELKSLYWPSGQASGDYYDFFPLSDKVLRTIVADVSGHGARAAFIMAIVRTLFIATRESQACLGETLATVNRHLIQVIGQEDDYVTLIAADIDLERGAIEYVNAGHCPGMLARPGEDTARLAPFAPLLGFFETPLAPRELAFPSGASLFFFTDGFYEWQRPDGSYYELDPFWDMASELLGQEGHFLERLMRKLTTMTDPPPEFRDDLSAVWIRAGGGA